MTTRRAGRADVMSRSTLIADVRAAKREATSSAVGNLDVSVAAGARNSPADAVIRYPAERDPRVTLQKTTVLVAFIEPGQRRFSLIKAIWWGRQDSNLRSHEAADLQSAPFATRDTPPLDGSTIGPDLCRRTEDGHGT